MTAVAKLAADLVNAKRERDRLLKVKEKAEADLKDATAAHLAAADAVNELRDKLETATDEAAKSE